MDLRTLVTGGAGFIGSNFVRYLLKNYSDIELTNLDLLTYAGRFENLNDVLKHPTHRFIKGDIRDKEKVMQVLKENDIEMIINFAAETHVDRSILDPFAFISTNIVGTYNLLESARKCNVNKFLQISTDEVYGSTLDRSFKEIDPLCPSSPYSASKASADLMVIAFYKTYGVDVNIVRSSNNFGPYQYPEKLIPKSILRALTGKHLPIYGDGTQIRDWTYVIDNCEAINLVALKGNSGEIYNIASGNELTNLEVAQHILKILGKPNELIKFVSDRPGHDRRYSLDTTKIKSLGWKPKHSFKVSLRKTIEWYLNNESWWKPLLKDLFIFSDTPYIQEKENNRRNFFS
jgi:dTDP-glucose 4,6-dehydratase